MTEATSLPRDPGRIPLVLALVPMAVLISLLALNVWLYKDNATYGANQFALVLAAACTTGIGVWLGVPLREVIQGMLASISSSLNALLILMLIGGLTGTWLISGIVPAMIYYGLAVLSPEWFLVAAVLICSLVSVATGSSWTTVATVGIALMGIGQTLGLNPAMIAGAIISGAYFGDKISPLSDTTNLAPAMAGAELFTHIRYMLITTVPAYVITLAVFGYWGSQLADLPTAVSTGDLSAEIAANFQISGWLLLVPAAVVVLVLWRVEATTTLFLAMILGAVVAVVFQPQLIQKLSPEVTSLIATAEPETAATKSGEASERGATATTRIPAAFHYPLQAYNTVVNSITGETQIPSDNQLVSQLLKSKGMSGMLNTIWLILCAMSFGGAMEAVGLLERITQPLVQLSRTTGMLIGTTVASCVVINITAADQYLAIVVPGRMFRKAYADRGLAPQNLSRTLEDGGTVTSVLVPWNTCGATQASVLNVATMAYLPYCVFNYVSPLVSIFVGAFKIGIAQVAVGKDRQQQ